MDPASDHTVKDTTSAADHGFGAIAAGVIALIFLGFVVHAATLAPQAETGSAPHAAAPAKPAH